MAINFKDYNIGVTEVYAKEFRLNWENDKCAQIDELYIYYENGKNMPIVTAVIYI